MSEVDPETGQSATRAHRREVAMQRRLARAAGLPRRERRKLEVRHRILDAAAILIEENGFQATRVGDICERADVAHKTFFNHFASKQHVMRAIAGDALAELLANIEAAGKQPGSTRERILFFFQCIADMAREVGPMHREFLTEVIHASYEGDSSDQARRIHDAFGEIIHTGREAGDLSNQHPPETQIEMVLGAYYALMFNWANFDDYPIHERALSMARLLADALSKAEKEGE